MPTRPVPWLKLIPGLLFSLAVVALAASVLLFARVGALHGDTYPLFVYAEDARNVIPGTEVWLTGQKVGLVKSIGFRRVSTDTLSRLRIELDMLEKYRQHVRRDSYVEIRSGGSLIGAPVLHVSPGTPAFPALANGDSLQSRPQMDAEGIASAVAIASRAFPDLIKNSKEISKELSQTAGRMSAVTDDRGEISLRVLTRRATQLTSKASSKEGTLGLAIRDTTLAKRARGAIAAADSLQRLLASEQTSLGRLRRDSTLARTVGGLRDEISIVRALLAEPRGSAGRFMRDSALVMQLRRLERELDATFEDIKRHPFRYIAF